MEPGNRLCVECRMKAAQLFCTFTDQEIFLCGDCLPKHSAKRTRKGHPTWPISELLTYKDPCYFDRLEIFPSIQEQARQEVGKIDKAIAEYQTLTDKIVREVIATSSAAVAKLGETKKQLITEVEASLEEVERTLAEQQPRLHSKYGSVFRDLVEKPTSFQLFVFNSPICIVPPQAIISFKSCLFLPKEIKTEIREEPRITPAVAKTSPQPFLAPKPAAFPDKQPVAQVIQEPKVAPAVARVSPQPSHTSEL